MNQKIKTEDNDRLYRLGNSKIPIKAKPRPILLKFVRCNTRNTINRNKKVLKGKEISVMESLTAKRIKISKKTKKLYGFVHVWSQDDKIMFYVKSINKVKDFYN